MAVPVGVRPAPLLVVAIGNASRGDDALGPLLAARLRDEGWFDSGEPQAELLEAYQLQVEDALALQQRRAVLFIDAARAGVGPGVTLQRIEPAAAPATFTHALAPQALLALVPRVWGGQPPPAWLLAVEGEVFELGAPLSAAAAARLAAALPLARAWLRRRLARRCGQLSELRPLERLSGVQYRCCTSQETAMATQKYLFIYRNPAEPAMQQEPSPAEMQQLYAQWTAWKDKFKDEIVDLGDGLKPGGKLVRAGATTDGPLVESKEVLGGYSIVQAHSLARAVEISKSCPVLGMPGTSVEVREMAGY